MEMTSIYKVDCQTSEGDHVESLWKYYVWSTSIQIREVSERMREHYLLKNKS